MITWWIAQIALLGALLALGAYGAQSALHAAGRPTRWAWVGALMGTLALAAVAPMRAVPDAVVNTSMLVTSVTATSLTAAAPTGVLVTLVNAWNGVTMLAGRTVRDGWSLWHASVPAGTERVLLIVWIVASVALLAVFVAVHLRFQRRRAQWPLGMVHGTTVRIADDTGPAVIGVTNAEIVVPRWLLSRDDREQQLVLAHEREHLRLHDPLLLVLAQAAIVLLPWHPAVWWMASRLRLAVELDCDRRVLQRGASARDYGTLLIDLTDHRAGFGAALPAFSCTPSHLERRLIAMTPKPLRYPLVRALTTGAFASLALLAACEAKLPTADEMDRMTATTATQAAGRVGLVDTANMRYFVDDKPTTAARAEAIAPDSIANINVNKTSDGTGEVRIVMRRAGDAPSRLMRGFAVDTTIVINGATTTVLAKPRTPFSGLMIVDGVITDPAIATGVSPDQIVSVNVIKGPAATAKYSDPRATNGVIEITTKKAKP